VGSEELSDTERDDLLELLKQRPEQLSAKDASISGWADGVSCPLASNPPANR
jgi:hypothetical protein